MEQDTPFWANLLPFIYSLGWHWAAILLSVGVPEIADKAAQRLEAKYPNRAAWVRGFLTYERKLFLAFILFSLTLFWAAFSVWNEEHIAKNSLEKKLQNPQTNIAIIENLQGQLNETKNQLGQTKKELNEANEKIEQFTRKPEIKQLSDIKWQANEDGSYTGSFDVEIVSILPVERVIITASCFSIEGLDYGMAGISEASSARKIEGKNAYELAIFNPKKKVTVLVKTRKKEENVIVRFDFGADHVSR